MSNNKQSSVEFLEERIKITNKEVYAELFEDIEKAKAMHKEEHKRTYITGFGNVLQKFEQYYNETFNNLK